jgi:hypothetical protein
MPRTASERINIRHQADYRSTSRRCRQRCSRDAERQDVPVGFPLSALEPTYVVFRPQESHLGS